VAGKGRVPGVAGRAVRRDGDAGRASDARRQPQLHVPVREPRRHLRLRGAERAVPERGRLQGVSLAVAHQRGRVAPTGGAAQGRQQPAPVEDHRHGNLPGEAGAHQDHRDQWSEQDEKLIQN